MLFIRVLALRRAVDALICIRSTRHVLVRGRSPFSFSLVQALGPSRPGVSSAPEEKIKKKEMCHES